MAKTHRGRGIRALPAHGKGTCAICKKDSIKTLYEQEIDGKKVQICKYCKAALKNKAQKDARTGKAAAKAAAPAAAPAEAAAPAADAAKTEEAK